ncbi:hypothetical protein J8N05_32570 [Streptomyces sp. BH-SS-21]|uniref:Uncharacterized protein n=1 Tax=Streptomyces liliiviolaceus TaxID=2823109 RepID=A0A940Y4J2_9ACTN|nr:hypothetical protein [Streptomyces liliiviolaceus]MBQ0852906.1 hypothetical protein [Streptomyces liliiviolaceus]
MAEDRNVWVELADYDEVKGWRSPSEATEDRNGGYTGHGNIIIEGGGRSPGATEDRNFEPAKSVDKDGNVAVALRAAEDSNMSAIKSVVRWQKVAVALRRDRGSQLAHLLRRPLHPGVWRSPFSATEDPNIDDVEKTHGLPDGDGRPSGRPSIATKCPGRGTLR